VIYDTLLSRVRLRERIAKTSNIEIMFSPEVRYLSHLGFYPVWARGPQVSGKTRFKWRTAGTISVEPTKWRCFCYDDVESELSNSRRITSGRRNGWAWWLGNHIRTCRAVGCSHWALVFTLLGESWIWRPQSIHGFSMTSFQDQLIFITTRIASMSSFCLFIVSMSCHIHSDAIIVRHVSSLWSSTESSSPLLRFLLYSTPSGFTSLLPFTGSIRGLIILDAYVYKIMVVVEIAETGLTVNHISYTVRRPVMRLVVSKP
jgi:hypothetical protein